MQSSDNPDNIVHGKIIVLPEISLPSTILKAFSAFTNASKVMVVSKEGTVSTLRKTITVT